MEHKQRLSEEKPEVHAKLSKTAIIGPENMNRLQK